MFRRLLLAALLTWSLPALAQDRSITVASTTSTEQSGLFGYLLPIFTRDTGITVRVVALGTGQALDVGRRGDADVLFVHDRVAERRFVEEGHGGPRHHVMFNDFVIVGPASDPAGIAGTRDPAGIAGTRDPAGIAGTRDPAGIAGTRDPAGIAGTRDTAAALKRIAATHSPFVSRGDRSGTHAAELRLWQAAGVDPVQGRGDWYKEVGQGMGPALNTAAAQDAYILTDRGTWLNFRNRQNLRIVVEGDARLFNQYGVMLVSPQRHPSVKAADGQAFIDWLISPAGQQAIAGYRINGEQLFFPNAAEAEPGA